MPISMVHLANRPMGGAFGGKFTKHMASHCAAAIACQAVGKAVCVTMSITDDMGISGETRHPVKVHYKVSHPTTGAINYTL